MRRNFRVCQRICKSLCDSCEAAATAVTTKTEESAAAAKMTGSITFTCEYNKIEI